MQCSDCGQSALYVSGFPVANDVYYCASCLPSNLWEAAANGMLNIPTQTKYKKTTPSAADAAPVVDPAPVVDATPVVDPAAPSAGI